MHGEKDAQGKERTERDEETNLMPQQLRSRVVLCLPNFPGLDL